MCSLKGAVHYFSQPCWSYAGPCSLPFRSAHHLVTRFYDYREQSLIIDSCMNATPQTLLYLILYPECPHRQGGCLAEVALIYTRTRRSRGTAHEGGGCNQSIGYTVSDAIVCSWLLLTATRSSPLGCFSTLLKVVDN